MLKELWKAIQDNAHEVHLMHGGRDLREPALYCTKCTEKVDSDNEHRCETLHLDD